MLKPHEALEVVRAHLLETVADPDPVDPQVPPSTCNSPRIGA